MSQLGPPLVKALLGLCSFRFLDFILQKYPASTLRCPTEGLLENKLAWIPSASTIRSPIYVGFAIKSGAVEIASPMFAQNKIP